MFSTAAPWAVEGEGGREHADPGAEGSLVPLGSGSESPGCRARVPASGPRTAPVFPLSHAALSSLCLLPMALNEPVLPCRVAWRASAFSVHSCVLCGAPVWLVH